MARAPRPVVRSGRVASRRTADRGRWTGTRLPCRGPAVRRSHVQPGKPSSGPVTPSRLWRSAACTAAGTRAGQAFRRSATLAATHRPARRACRRRESRAPVPESLTMLAPELLGPASCAGAPVARRLRGWHQRRSRCVASPRRTCRSTPKTVSTTWRDQARARRTATRSQGGKISPRPISSTVSYVVCSETPNKFQAARIKHESPS